MLKVSLRAGRSKLDGGEGRGEGDQGGDRIHIETQSIQLDLDTPVSSHRQSDQIELDKGPNKQLSKKEQK